MTRRRSILGSIVFATLLIASCRPVEPAPDGSGWPNVALTQQTVMTRGGKSLSAMPLFIGPTGAAFEIVAHDPVEPTIEITLLVDGVLWPLETTVVETIGDGLWLMEVTFDKGGPAVGAVVLSVEWGGLHVSWSWRI